VHDIRNVYHPRRIPVGGGAWVLPAVGSAILAVIWGAYTLLVLYEIVAVSGG
jgi:hypothetical protein